MKGWAVDGTSSNFILHHFTFPSETRKKEPKNEIKRFFQFECTERIANRQQRNV